MTTEVATIGAPASGVPATAARTIVGDERAPVVVHEIALGERDDAAADAEQREDREVLARLRHHALVGGDDEQREVDAGGAGEHGAHEGLVARHVDDAERALAERRAARSRARS